MVRNFEAFRDEFEFSMVRPTQISNSLPDVAREMGWRSEIGAVAAVFGANASGKSTFFRALAQIVRDVNALPNRAAHGKPFLLDDTHRLEPTEFEITFIADSIDGAGQKSEYSYAYSVLENVIVQEQLYARVCAPKKQWRMVFARERDDTSFDGCKYVWGTLMRGQKDLIRKLTKSGELFLASSSRFPEDPLLAVSNWFASSIEFFSANRYQQALPQIARRLEGGDEKFSESLNRFLRAADLGICGIHVEHLPNQYYEAIRQKVAKISEEVNIDIDELIENETTYLVYEHRSGASAVHLRQEQESEGTVAMTAFASIALQALNVGGTLVIDELDTSLHPLLVRKLVEQFADPESNPNQAQLIFTTHDITLMLDSPGISRPLERDQIWLTEKDREGAATMVSLWDFDPRKGEDIFHRYLLGRYGAIASPVVPR